MSCSSSDSLPTEWRRCRRCLIAKHFSEFDIDSGTFLDTCRACGRAPTAEQNSTKSTMSELGDKTVFTHTCEICSRTMDLCKFGMDSDMRIRPICAQCMNPDATHATRRCTQCKKTMDVCSFRMKPDGSRNKGCLKCCEKAAAATRRRVCPHGRRKERCAECKKPNA